MTDDMVPNLRGGHMANNLAAAGPFITIAVFVGSLVWQAAQYANKDSVATLRDEVWRLRLASEHQADEQRHAAADTGRLQDTVNKILAIQQQQLIDDARRKK